MPARLRKYLLRAGIVTVALAVAVPLALYGFAQTGAGRAWIADTVSALASSGEASVRIEGLDGHLPFDFRIASVTVDAAGARVADIRDVAVDWRPFALLGGAAHVRSLTVGSASVRVDAAGDSATTAEPSGGSGFGLPVDIRLDRARIERLRILGAGDAALQLSAEATLRIRRAAREAVAKLAVERLDAPGHARIDLEHHVDPARFSLDADVADPAGGLISTLAGISGLPGVAVSIRGSGPPDAWKGRLAAKLGGQEALDAKLAVSVGPQTSVGLSAALRPGGLIPAGLRPLLGETMSLDAEIRLAGKSRIELAKLDLRAGAVSAGVTGDYGIADGAVRLDGAATLDRQAATGRSGVPLPANLRLEYGLSGRIGALDARLRATASGVVPADGISVAAIEADVKARLGGADFGSIDFDAAARLTGVGLTFEGVPPETIPSARLALRGSLAALDQLTIPTASLETARVRLLGSDLAFGLARGDLSAVVEAQIADIAAFAATRDSLARGGLSLTARLEGRPAAGTLGATIDGRLSGLRLRSLGSAAIPPRIELSGRAALGEDRLSLTAFKVAADGVQLRGEAGMDLATGKATARLDGTVRDLAAYSKLAGVPLGGALRLEADIAGSGIADASGRLRIDIDRPAIASVTAPRLAAEATMTPAGGGARGTANLTVDVPGGRLVLDAPYTLSGERLLAERIRLSAPHLSGGGKADVNLESGKAGGELNVEADDLRRLAAAFGMRDLPVEGALSVVAAGRLDGEMSFRASARRLGWDAHSGGVSVGSATLSGRLRGIEGTPAGSVEIAADGVTAAGVRIARVTGTLAGQPGKPFDVALRASGIADPKNAVATTGRLTLADDRVRFDLTGLDGALAGEKLALDRPGVVTIVGETVDADLPGIRVGSGALALAGKLDPRKVDGRVQLGAVPLKIAGALGVAPVTAGTLDLAATVSGKPGAPDARVTSRIAGLRFGLGGAEDAPPIAADISAETRAGVLSAKVRLSAPDIPPLDVVASAGSTKKPVFGFADDMPVSATVKGSGKLGPMLALVLPDGDRATGDWRADLSVSGTVAAPHLSGELAVMRGEYENGLAGTVVSRIEMRIVARDRRFEVTKLEGRDRGSGRFSATGAFEIGESLDVTGRGELTLKRFRAARRDDAEVVASGRLAFEMTAQRASLTGKLTVDRADIQIPEKLPVSFSGLDVVEIRNGEVVKQPGDARAPAGPPIALDVVIDLPGQVFVRGRGLNTEWKGRFDVRGTVAEPAPSGEMTLVRGTFAFAGRTFKITEGRITVPRGGGDLDPTLYVRTEARIEDTVAQVVVEGNASAPKISVSSTPPLPREEVLSLILFGKTSAQLSPLQAAQLAQSAATLSGNAGSGGVLDRIRKATGLDVLDVESNGDSADGSTLKAGKYIADGVFVSAGRGIEPGSGKVGVEIELFPNVTVDSEVGSDSDSSVGINLKYDY